MKLAFTTLGCPNWNVSTIIENAQKNGYSGVDFRGYMGEMDIFKTPEFSTNIEDTKSRFRQAGLIIPCFSSSIKLLTHSDNERRKNLDELYEYVSLCEEFDTPFIRIFCGQKREKTKEEALNVIASNLEVMLNIVKKRNIILLLETHDDWTRSEDVLKVLDKAKESPFLKVLWDVHHPYRQEEEAPEKTWADLGKDIYYTHWKDSYLDINDEKGYQLCLMGDGTVPFKEIYQLLIDNNYEGYFTFEWEKVWYPELEEPDVAFRQYANFMRELERKTTD